MQRTVLFEDDVPGYLAVLARALCRYTRGDSRLRRIPFVSLSPYIAANPAGGETASLPADRCSSEQAPPSDSISINEALHDGARRSPLADRLD